MLPRVNNAHTKCMLPITQPSLRPFRLVGYPKPKPNFGQSLTQTVDKCTDMALRQTVYEIIGCARPYELSRAKLSRPVTFITWQGGSDYTYVRRIVKQSVIKIYVSEKSATDLYRPGYTRA